ncbi:FecR domain-containing protein [Herbaspirillum sp. LeCh32-8]|uniref:FecR family protein n=1 Tax=Herbaspirillum sp. LeCh32-8 TaxID=2821356 RepID=UPI001AE48595|nr:FecR domain-containing protein [Herbaspirillum sp. LeCh32-8]MBP0597145.1 FecR domain-containing protein [Herbaspirillum sp. LeCh32-8]
MNSSSSTPNDTDLLERQAADWLVRLGHGSAAERRQAEQAFGEWKAADPRHASAAAGMERFLAQFAQIRKPTDGDGRAAHLALESARQTTRAKRSRVRRTVAALCLALAVGVPGYSLLHAYPPTLLMADLRTADGAWQTHTLEDGTRITLQGGSAVNLRYDAKRRAVQLLRGEILVEVAKDAARPFLVETAQGSIRALGTRFVVQEADAVTTLSMLESKVRVRAAADADADGIVVAAGQRVRITTAGVGAVEPVDGRSIDDAWRYRQLVVSDRPLAEVLDQLARNRPGTIRYDRAQIAGIRVSAVLPLDDTDRALQLLKNNFPALRIRSFSSWLVWVDAPDAANGPGSRASEK